MTASFTPVLTIPGNHQDINELYRAVTPFDGRIVKEKMSNGRSWSEHAGLFILWV